MRTWYPPVAIVGLLGALAAAFAIGGPRAAMPVGTAALLAVIVLAVRQKPVESIVPPLPPDEAARVLVVVAAPVEDSGPARELAEAIDAAADRFDTGAGSDRFGATGGGEVKVLAPARTGFADRWASDVSKARDEAQRNLVITVATLAAAGIEAAAQVGDADIVQATEDLLRDYPATAVILVTPPGRRDRGAEKALGELSRRLAIPLRRVSSD